MKKRVRPEKYRKALGEVIQSKRLRLNLSQEELGHRVKLQRTYIGTIERGEMNITIRNILKISKALETTPSKLLAAVERQLA